jgi:branched-chain amino acid transport system permease protein
VIFGIDVVSILLGGFAAGMVLFIVSVGLSVTMGLMGFVNLAHGGFAMIGGYVIVLAMNRWGVGFIPALALGFVVTAAFSVVLERLLYCAPLPRRRARSGAVHDRPRLHHDRLGDAAGRPREPADPAPQMLRGQIDLGITSTAPTASSSSSSASSFVIGALARLRAHTHGRPDPRRRRQPAHGRIARHQRQSPVHAHLRVRQRHGGARRRLGAEFLGLDPQYALKYLVFFLIVVAVGGSGASPACSTRR